MQKENEKAKNTAVEINAKSVRKWEYVPCKSYGPFKLGDRISKYLDTIEENFGYIYYLHFHQVPFQHNNADESW